jgi:hypothetical protein
VILAAIRYHSLGKIPQSLERALAPVLGRWQSKSCVAVICSARERFPANLEDDRLGRFAGGIVEFGRFLLLVIFLERYDDFKRAFKIVQEKRNKREKLFS